MSVLIRTIEDWKKIFAGLPSREAALAPERVIADRIISDLLGYRHRSKDREIDAQNIANALQAYFNMCQKYGVQVARVK